MPEWVLNLVNNSLLGFIYVCLSSSLKIQEHVLKLRYEYFD